MKMKKIKNNKKKKLKRKQKPLHGKKRKKLTNKFKMMFLFKKLPKKNKKLLKNLGFPK